MAQLTFPDKQSSPDNLVIDRSVGTMYYLDGGLYRMDVAAGSLPEQALVAAGDRTFYGLGVHPQTGELYVTDAKNYTENGDIYRFAQSGSLVDSFSAGRIPGYVAFHTP